MKPLIITRHAALVEYLLEIGIEGDVCPHVAHEDEVRGRWVVGPVPLHLAAAADRITQVPLDLPRELRGAELTLPQVRQYAGPLRTYRVEAL